MLEVRGALGVEIARNLGIDAEFYISISISSTGLRIPMSDTGAKERASWTNLSFFKTMYMYNFVLYKCALFLTLKLPLYQYEKIKMSAFKC